MTQQAQTHKPAPPPILMTWYFIKGAALPFMALTLAIVIALGLGVLAAEDWDGFAQRINLGKTIAFYSSIAIGSYIALRLYKPAAKQWLYRAQFIGLSFALILWVIAL